SLISTHPPHRISQIISNDQRAARINRHTDGAAAGLAVVGAKAGYELHRLTGWSTVFEGNEDHLVAHRIFSVPAAVFSDKYAIGVLRAHDFAGEVQAEGGDVGAQGVVRRDGGGNLVRVLRPHAVVDILAPVAVGPAVEASFLYRCQVIRHQVLPYFVPFVDYRPQLPGTRLDGEGSRVTQAGCVGFVSARLGVDLPDERTIHFGLHATLGEVAVGTDTHIEEATVRADGQRLGPVMIDL